MSLAAFATAEAPYHLPRPLNNAPSLNYNNQIQQIPHPNLIPGPITQHGPSPNYQYQYSTVQQQIPQSNYFRGSGYQYQQPSIAPAYVQPQPIVPFQQISQTQPQIYQQPNAAYNLPQIQGGYSPLSGPQASGYVQNAPQQQIGVAYQQRYATPIAQSYSTGQSIGQSPLGYRNQQSSYSSYQADSNAYTGNQGHRDPLDSTVVDRLQNILTENEHISARSNGFLSLVSGVSLEGARPSVEISSFVHNSQLGREGQNQGPSLQDLARGPLSAGPARPVPSGNNGQSNQGQISLNFLPQPQSSSSYGPPN